MKKLLIAATFFLMTSCPAGAQTIIKFALPTPETHPRNQALVLWANDVVTQSQGQLIVDLEHGVTDYTGGGLSAAVAEGAYDMAAVGWWHVSRISPGFGLSALPMFYGRDRDIINKIFDGELGRALNDRLEKKLRVRVLGRRLGLGFGHIFTVKKAIKTYEDLQDLNIRVPGGGADLARYLTFDAIPRRVAVRDLADALRRNLVGGLLTTHNFVADGSLWKAGVRHAFLDNQVFYQYTPIINRSRWEALFDDERKWLSQSWEATIDNMRQAMAERQAKARGVAAKNGVSYLEASDAQRRTMRSILLKEQSAIAAALEIDPQLIARAKALLDGIVRKK